MIKSDIELCKVIYGSKRMMRYVLYEKMIPHSEWRMAALEGNDFTCMECGLKDPLGKQLEVHHILPVSKYPELTRDYGNAITLCERCHREVKGREEGLAEHFFSKVNYRPLTIEELDIMIDWSLV